jgi:threonine/homoserine/homoserine lactone efflux protein
MALRQAIKPAYGQQFHFEDQGGVGRDHVAGTSIAIGHRWRAGQARLAADLDALQPLGPCPRVTRWLNRLAGTLLVGFGVKLALSR